MFISEEEFQRRNRSEANLVNRVVREESPPNESPAHKEILPPPTPSFDINSILNISELPKEPEIRPRRNSSKDSFDKTLDKLLNPQADYAGRGTKLLHRDAQAGIGVAAGILGDRKGAALGEVATSSAHSYKAGYTGPVDKANPAKSPKEELQEKIIEGHGIVVDKAFGRLLKSLDLLDDAKLEKVQKASELSVIAKNLSSIVTSASHATKDHVIDSSEKSVHFHIMKPEMAQDSDYPVLEVSSEKSELEWQEHNRG
jgi:hypothetical protein